MAEGWNGSGVRGDKQPLISVVYPENLVREHAEVSTETSFRGQKGPVLYEPDGLNAPTALHPGVEDITLNKRKSQKIRIHSKNETLVQDI